MLVWLQGAGDLGFVSLAEPSRVGFVEQRIECELPSCAVFYTAASCCGALQGEFTTNSMNCIFNFQYDGGLGPQSQPFRAPVRDLF